MFKMHRERMNVTNEELKKAYNEEQKKKIQNKDKYNFSNLKVRVNETEYINEIIILDGNKKLKFSGTSIEMALGRLLSWLEKES